MVKRYLRLPSRLSTPVPTAGVVTGVVVVVPPFSFECWLGGGGGSGGSAFCWWWWCVLLVVVVVVGVRVCSQPSFSPKQKSQNEQNQMKMHKVI